MEEEQREWADLDRKHKLEKQERARKIAAGELPADDPFDIPF